MMMQFLSFLPLVTISPSDSAFLTVPLSATFSSGFPSVSGGVMLLSGPLRSL